jgi:hypothetical protein
VNLDRSAQEPVAHEVRAPDLAEDHLLADGPAGVPHEEKSLDEMMGWGCDRLWSYVKALVKEIGSRDADFRRNKKGYDYDSKGYLGHVHWYQKVQAQLSRAREAYDRACGGLSVDAWRKLDKWIYKDPADLGHPGMPEWAWLIAGGGSRWFPIPGRSLIPA